MKLTILGTGNAMVTKCYNTCFAIEQNDEYFLVDGGGGNQILSKLEKANIDWNKIKNIFVTHKHIDHITGIIWLVRVFTQNMSRGTFDKEVNLYAHSELIKIITDIATMLLQPKQIDYIGKKFHLISVEDGDEITILGNKVKFFDIHSTKAKQFGFTMYYGKDKLTCCGDEPYNEVEKEYVQDSTYLLHEAFCLYEDREKFHPYEKHHSTVKDACILAEKLNVKNLILYHTEDKNITNRKELYTKEGKEIYSGNIYVPDDLEVFNL